MSQQLELLPMREDPAGFSGEAACLMHRALEAIAGSTLLEFEDAVKWGQWCRVTAAGAIRDASRRAA